MVTWLYIIVIIIVQIIWVRLDDANVKDVGVGVEDVRFWWARYNGSKYRWYGQYEMTSQVNEHVIRWPEEQNDGSN